MSAVKIEPIQTIVMMDFETTGLIPGDRRDPLERAPLPGDTNRCLDRMVSNFILLVDTPAKMPRITEFSFVSVPRALFVDGIERMQSKFNCLEEEDVREPLSIRLPVNVHTRQVCPKLTEQQWFEYEENRRNCDAIQLSRADLVHKNSFAEEWPGVIQFLSSLKKPSVIIAHNGVKFDFRILYAELKLNELLEKYPIPNGVYFLDSYFAFLDLEKDYHDCAKLVTSLVDWPKISELIHSAAQKDQQEEDSVSKANSGNITVSVDVSELLPKPTPFASTFGEASRSNDVHVLVSAKPVGNVTPPRSLAKRSLFMDGSKSEPARKRQKLHFEDLDNHPLNFMRTSDWSPAKKKRLKRNFFERVENEDWRFSNLVEREYFFGRKGNFKLANMFTELLNESFDSHRAQADCEALLQVCLAFGKDFLDYIDKNRAEFPLLCGKNAEWTEEFLQKLNGSTSSNQANNPIDSIICINE